MSEETVRSLLDEWVDATYSFLPKTPKWSSLTHSRIEVDDSPHRENRDLAVRDALRLRRSLEALNALSCCRGFRVWENMAFWKGQLASLGHDVHETEASLYALHDDLFSKYDVRKSFSNDPIEVTASSIATCFSMDAASEAMKLRRDIHKRLAPFLMSELPMLDIELKIECSLDAHYGNWLDLGGQQDLVDVWSARNCLIAIADFYVGASSLSNMRALHALACVELREVNLKVPVETAAGELSAFVRELVRVNTVRTMAWHFQRADRLFSETIFSAIPSMTWLESFAVKCDDLNNCFNPSHSSGIRAYYAWLLYALARCNASADVQFPNDFG